MKHRSRTILVTPDDEAMANEIAAVYPLVKPHRIYQVSLRCGLRVIREDPERLVREALDAPDDDAEAPGTGGAVVRRLRDACPLACGRAGERVERRLATCGGAPQR